MRLLWLGNTPLPAIARDLGVTVRFGNGWLQALAGEIPQKEGYELYYLFFSTEVSSPQSGIVDGIHYHCFPYDPKVMVMEEALLPVVQAIKPDIVHIFGTEYPWSEALLRVCKGVDLLDRTLLHIQGLVSFCRMHSAKEIPTRWKYLMVPRDFLRDTSIRHGLKEFERQATHEVAALQMLRHVSGRTDWDEASVLSINPQLRYYRCNEILRDSFYQRTWSIGDCQRHSIFISQGQHPIKGLHLVLQALPAILRSYPDTMVYVAGHDVVMEGAGLSDQLRRNTYGWYLLSLIRRHGLSKHIRFTGPLNEEEMCERFLSSHVYLSPSTIENSPNSLGEAMLLGMPCVASFVGGVASVIRDQEEGYLYQADAPYMLAHYVMKHFSDDDRAVQMGRRARDRALVTHNREKNMQALYGIYDALMLGEG